jgi:hypothetical protein
MSKKKYLVAAGLALGLVAIGGAAIARPDGMKGGGFPGKMMLRLFGDLNLSEQQELKAIRMRRALSEQGQQARQETFKSLEPAIAELGKAQPDARKMHLIADEAIARYAKIVHSAIDQAIDLHSTLTPEQRTTLATRAQEIHDKREQRMERRFEEKQKPAKSK